MRKLISLIAGAGDWLVSLSDRAKKQLVITLLLILGSGGLYKLLHSIEAMQKPLPAASPAELIVPMEKLFEQTRESARSYEKARDGDMRNLDSLAKAYAKQNSQSR